MEDRINNILAKLLILQEKTPLRKEEKMLVKQGKLDEVIYSRIVSTKFRKSKMLPETAEFIKQYLRKTVPANKPLRIYFCFGGYKQARLSSAPDPEWAETFNLNFSLQMAAYVESIYPPGVEMIYRGDEVIMTYLCNYKVADRKRYTEQFTKMLELFQPKIPAERKITMRYELTSETSSEQKLISYMEKVYDKYVEKFESLDRTEQEKKILVSYRNQCWQGEKDLTQLSEAEKRARSKWAFIMHGAFLEADITIAKEYFDNGISISYRRGVPGCLHYGSCSSCSVQFWAGEGFLKQTKERLIPWILSYEQQQGVTWEVEKIQNQIFNELGLKEIRILNQLR